MTTSRRPHKPCRDCGAMFETSPCDKTVRCPSCRKPKAKAAHTYSGPKPVDPRGHKCTVRMGAVHGGTCGKPAVFAFESGIVTGEVFAECADHYEG